MKEHKHKGLWLFGLICATILPWLLDVYHQHVLIVSLFYVIMASSWNLIAGYTGQVSFGHAAFAGIGAYVSGILSVRMGINPWLGVLAGISVAALFGFLMGLLCLRMGGIYLSLTTLGFSEILHIVINNEYEITRGTMGLQIPGLLAEYSKIGYFYIFLVAALVALIIIYVMIHSNLGLSFRAVQNDEQAASSLGVNVVKVRILAFTVSSSLAGMAGGLYSHYLMLVTPHIASLDEQFLVLSMTVIGGLGSFIGPIIGAISLEILSEYIRAWGEYHVLVFGLIALLAARFAPKGLVGLYKNRRYKQLKYKQLMKPAS